jgi:NADPH:quinone reductase-like Zn-dependent oxidoreductase
VQTPGRKPSTTTAGVPRLDHREQHFFIPGPKNNLRLFLRLLTSEKLLTVGRRAVLYVHGATFPSALSIAHRFDGRSWRDALCQAGFDVWGLDFYGFGHSAILGRDVSGVVRAVDANVKHFKAGDRVLALSNATYAELVAVNDSDLTHLPEGVDLADAAAIPLIALTGDQLVRLATKVQKGQVVLITGALGSVGRAAVHTAKKMGAQVIAGVRGKELGDARSLGVSDVLAIDDDESIEKFRLVDAIADTVGGAVATKLIAKIKPGGFFGYTAVLPQSAATLNPEVKITRVLAQPDPPKVREFADDVRDGKFVLPIGRRMPLHDALRHMCSGREAGSGRFSCWCRIHKIDFFTTNSVKPRSVHVVVLQALILRAGFIRFAPRG